MTDIFQLAYLSRRRVDPFGCVARSCSARFARLDGKNIGTRNLFFPIFLPSVPSFALVGRQHILALIIGMTHDIMPYYDFATDD